MQITRLTESAQTDVEPAYDIEPRRRGGRTPQRSGGWAPTDPMQHFAKEKWWVKLLALFLTQLKYIMPPLVLFGFWAKHQGWW